MPITMIREQLVRRDGNMMAQVRGHAPSLYALRVQAMEAFADRRPDLRVYGVDGGTMGTFVPGVERIWTMLFHVEERSGLEALYESTRH